MEYRNVKYNRHGTIDCEVNHPVFGWNPTTVRPDDADTAALYDQIFSDGAVIAPYVPPSQDEIRQNMFPLTRRQFKLGMLNLGISTAMINQAIAGIADPAAQAVAQIEFDEAQYFERNHSLVTQLAAAFNLTPEQLDAAWTASIAL